MTKSFVNTSRNICALLCTERSFYDPTVADVMKNVVVFQHSQIEEVCGNVCLRAKNICVLLV